MSGAVRSRSSFLLLCLMLSLAVALSGCTAFKSYAENEAKPSRTGSDFTYPETDEVVLTADERIVRVHSSTGLTGFTRYAIISVDSTIEPGDDAAATELLIKILGALYKKFPGNVNDTRIYLSDKNDDLVLLYKLANKIGVDALGDDISASIRVSRKNVSDFVEGHR